MGIYSILDFGACGDGVTNDSGAIQRAMDACGIAGGGIVIIPAGRNYRAGSFEFRSNVELQIERGAKLISAHALEDFPHHVFARGPDVETRVWIRARHCQNIAITGGGEIDGQCHAFATEELPHIYRTVHWKPAMTCFVGCRNIRVRDVCLRNSAFWTLHFVGCEDIVVQGVSILNNLKFPNCDGIDPDHCRNVRISDCHIEAGDDCIVLKNTAPFADFGPTENVTVTGCTLVSTSSAIKIGSESCGDFRNCVFDACLISRSHRGLSIQLRDPGNVENVIFSNMTIETRLFHADWWGAGEPIYVTALPRTSQTIPGTIRNVRFSGLLCRSESGVFVKGHTPDSIQDVTFDNVRIMLEKRSKWNDSRHDCRPCAGPGITEQQPNGFYVENAQDVVIRNSQVVKGEHPAGYFGAALNIRSVGGFEHALCNFF